MDNDFQRLDDFTHQELISEVYRRGIDFQTVESHWNTLIIKQTKTYAELDEENAETE